ncbi:hypothetical protein BKA82DRAFT_2584946 [Pisolithus tinctorius]|nr:hypothetical protein BKA82DRAFT_2584946 [Pisolithus tinctorius]
MGCADQLHTVIIKYVSNGFRDYHQCVRERRTYEFRLCRYDHCFLCLPIYPFCSPSIIHQRVSSPPGIPTECVCHPSRPNEPVRSGVNKCLYCCSRLPLLPTLTHASGLSTKTFPFCVKYARVVVIILLVNDFIMVGTTTETLVKDDVNIWFRNPNVIAEWTLQIAGNLYSVSLFLCNLHVRARPLKSFLINSYVTVISVLRATPWFSRPEWAQPCNEPSSDEMLRRRLEM